MKGLKTCVICKMKIPPEHNNTWFEGHNAEPVANGRCCKDCNEQIVIPARLVGLIKR